MSISQEMRKLAREVEGADRTAGVSNEVANGDAFIFSGVGSKGETIPQDIQVGSQRESLDPTSDPKKDAKKALDAITGLLGRIRTSSEKSRTASGFNTDNNEWVDFRNGTVSITVFDFTGNPGKEKRRLKKRMDDLVELVIDALDEDPFRVRETGYRPSKRDFKFFSYKSGDSISGEAKVSRGLWDAAKLDEFMWNVVVAEKVEKRAGRFNRSASVQGEMLKLAGELTVMKRSKTMDKTTQEMVKLARSLVSEELKYDSPIDQWLVDNGWDEGGGIALYTNPKFPLVGIDTNSGDAAIEVFKSKSQVFNTEGALVDYTGNLGAVKKAVKKGNAIGKLWTVLSKKYRGYSQHLTSSSISFYPERDDQVSFTVWTENWAVVVGGGHKVGFRKIRKKMSPNSARAIVKFIDDSQEEILAGGGEK